MRVCKLCRCNDLLVGSRRISVTDIFQNGSRKEMRILYHKRHGTAQILLFDVPKVNAVISNAAVLNFIEPVHQIDDRSFSGARRAYEGNFSPGRANRLICERTVFPGTYPKDTSRKRTSPASGTCLPRIGIKPIIIAGRRRAEASLSPRPAPVFPASKRKSAPLRIRRKAKSSASS